MHLPVRICLRRSGRLFLLLLAMWIIYISSRSLHESIVSVPILRNEASEVSESITGRPSSRHQLWSTGDTKQFCKDFKVMIPESIPFGTVAPVIIKTTIQEWVSEDILVIVDVRTDIAEEGRSSVVESNLEETSMYRGVAMTSVVSESDADIDIYIGLSKGELLCFTQRRHVFYKQDQNTRYISNALLTDITHDHVVIDSNITIEEGSNVVLQTSILSRTRRHFHIQVYGALSIMCKSPGMCFYGDSSNEVQHHSFITVHSGGSLNINGMFFAFLPSLNSSTHTQHPPAFIAGEQNSKINITGGGAVHSQSPIFSGYLGGVRLSDLIIASCAAVGVFSGSTHINNITVLNHLGLNDYSAVTLMGTLTNVQPSLRPTIVRSKFIFGKNRAVAVSGGNAFLSDVLIDSYGMGGILLVGDVNVTVNRTAILNSSQPFQILNGPTNVIRDPYLNVYDCVIDSEPRLGSTKKGVYASMLGVVYLRSQKGGGTLFSHSPSSALIDGQQYKCKCCIGILTRSIKTKLDEVRRRWHNYTMTGCKYIIGKILEGMPIIGHSQLTNYNLDEEITIRENETRKTRYEYDHDEVHMRSEPSINESHRDKCLVNSEHLPEIERLENLKFIDKLQKGAQCGVSFVAAGVIGGCNRTFLFRSDHVISNGFSEAVFDVSVIPYIAYTVDNILETELINERIATTFDESKMRFENPQYLSVINEMLQCLGKRSSTRYTLVASSKSAQTSAISPPFFKYLLNCQRGRMFKSIDIQSCLSRVESKESRAKDHEFESSVSIACEMSAVTKRQLHTMTMRGSHLPSLGQFVKKQMKNLRNNGFRIPSWAPLISADDMDGRAVTLTSIYNWKCTGSTNNANFDVKSNPVADILRNKPIEKIVPENDHFIFWFKDARAKATPISSPNPSILVENNPLLAELLTYLVDLLLGNQLTMPVVLRRVFVSCNTVGSENCSLSSFEPNIDIERDFTNRVGNAMRSTNTTRYVDLVLTAVEDDVTIESASHPIDHQILAKYFSQELMTEWMVAKGYTRQFLKDASNLFILNFLTKNIAPGNWTFSKNRILATGNGNAFSNFTPEPCLQLLDRPPMISNDRSLSCDPNFTTNSPRFCRFHRFTINRLKEIQRFNLVYELIKTLREDKWWMQNYGEYLNNIDLYQYLNNAVSKVVEYYATCLKKYFDDIFI